MRLFLEEVLGVPGPVQSRDASTEVRAIRADSVYTSAWKLVRNMANSHDILTRQTPG